MNTNTVKTENTSYTVTKTFQRFSSLSSLRPLLPLDHHSVRKKRSDHCLHLDRGQRVFLWFLRSSRWTPCGKLIWCSHCMETVSQQAVYMIGCTVSSVSHSVSSLSHASAVFTLSLSFFGCFLSSFATVLVMGCCVLFISLRISTLKARLIKTPFSPLSNYSIYVLLHMSCPFFMSLFIARLLIFFTLQ